MKWYLARRLEEEGGREGEMIKWLFDVDAFGRPIGCYLPQHLVKCEDEEEEEGSALFHQAFRSFFCVTIICTFLISPQFTGCVTLLVTNPRESVDPDVRRKRCFILEKLLVKQKKEYHPDGF